MPTSKKSFQSAPSSIGTSNSGNADSSSSPQSQNIEMQQHHHHHAHVHRQLSQMNNKKPASFNDNNGPRLQKQQSHSIFTRVPSAQPGFDGLLPMASAHNLMANENNNNNLNGNNGIMNRGETFSLGTGGGGGMMLQPSTTSGGFLGVPGDIHHSFQHQHHHHHNSSTNNRGPASHASGSTMMLGAGGGNGNGADDHHLRVGVAPAHTKNHLKSRLSENFRDYLSQSIVNQMEEMRSPSRTDVNRRPSAFPQQPVVTNYFGGDGERNSKHHINDAGNNNINLEGSSTSIASLGILPQQSNAPNSKKIKHPSAKAQIEEAAKHLRINPDFLSASSATTHPSLSSSNSNALGSPVNATGATNTPSNDTSRSDAINVQSYHFKSNNNHSKNISSNLNASTNNSNINNNNHNASMQKNNQQSAKRERRRFHQTDKDQRSSHVIETISVSELNKMKHLFDTHDIDHSGSIDEDELMPLLEELGHPMKRCQAKDLLSQVDVNGNGLLEFSEFLQLVLIFKNVAQFRLYDDNGQMLVGVNSSNPGNNNNSNNDGDLSKAGDDNSGQFVFGGAGGGHAHNNSNGGANMFDGANSNFCSRLCGGCWSWFSGFFPFNHESGYLWAWEVFLLGVCIYIWCAVTSVYSFNDVNYTAPYLRTYFDAADIVVAVLILAEMIRNCFTKVRVSVVHHHPLPDGALAAPAISHSSSAAAIAILDRDSAEGDEEKLGTQEASLASSFAGPPPPAPAALGGSGATSRLLSTVPEIARNYIFSVWFICDALSLLPLRAMITENSWASLILCHLRILFLYHLKDIMTRRSFADIDRWFVYFFLSFAPIASGAAAFIAAVHICAIVSLRIALTNTYAQSVYVVLYTFSGAGFGDIEPKNDAHRIFYAILCLLSMVVNGFVIGSIVSFFASSDVDSVRKSRLVQTLAVLDFFQVPVPLQEEILQFQNHLMAKNIQAAFAGIVESLPAEMKVGLGLQVRIQLVRSVELFRLAHPSTQIALAQELFTVVLCPEEFVALAQEEGEEMFFISYGFVDVLTAGGVYLQTLKMYESFGAEVVLGPVEDAIVMHKQNKMDDDAPLDIKTWGKYVNSAKTLTYVELLGLNVATFDVILRQFPRFRKTVEHVLSNPDWSKKIFSGGTKNILRGKRKESVFHTTASWRSSSLKINAESKQFNSSLTGGADFDGQAASSLNSNSNNPNIIIPGIARINSDLSLTSKKIKNQSHQNPLAFYPNNDNNSSGNQQQNSANHNNSSKIDTDGDSIFARQNSAGALFEVLSDNPQINSRSVNNNNNNNSVTGTSQQADPRARSHSFMQKRSLQMERIANASTAHQHSRSHNIVPRPDVRGKLRELGVEGIIGMQNLASDDDDDDDDDEDRNGENRNNNNNNNRVFGSNDVESKTYYPQEISQYYDDSSNAFFHSSIGAKNSRRNQNNNNGDSNEDDDDEDENGGNNRNKNPFLDTDAPISHERKLEWLHDLERMEILLESAIAEANTCCEEVQIDDGGDVADDQEEEQGEGDETTNEGHHRIRKNMNNSNNPNYDPVDQDNLRMVTQKSYHEYMLQSPHELAPFIKSGASSFIDTSGRGALGISGSSTGTGEGNGDVSFHVNQKGINSHHDHSHNLQEQEQDHHVIVEETDDCEKNEQGSLNHPKIVQSEHNGDEQQQTTMNSNNTNHNLTPPTLSPAVNPLFFSNNNNNNNGQFGSRNINNNNSQQLLHLIPLSDANGNLLPSLRVTTPMTNASQNNSFSNLSAIPTPTPYHQQQQNGNNIVTINATGNLTPHLTQNNIYNNSDEAAAAGRVSNSSTLTEVHQHHNNNTNNNEIMLSRHSSNSVDNNQQGLSNRGQNSNGNDDDE